MLPDDPTLTFNTLGRHVSRMVYTRVTSVKSPWFAGVNAGDVFAVPVSHGEGRFVATAEMVEKLAQKRPDRDAVHGPRGQSERLDSVEPERLGLRD